MKANPISTVALEKIAAGALIGSNLVPVCAIRGNALIVMNERCASLLGRSRDDVHKGIPLRDVVASADWPRFEDHLQKAIAKPASVTSIGISAVRKDGSIVEL